MSEKVDCIICGAKILSTTAEKNSGLCMPCKGGYRNKIDEAKLYTEKLKQARISPERKHWEWLVNQVSNNENGFNELTKENQLYFSVSLLEGEVYNGGFDQYFYNSSADYYYFALEGLKKIQAVHSYNLLLQAKETIFGNINVPSTQLLRFEFLRTKGKIEGNEDILSKKLDEIDSLFYKDLDNLNDKLINFANNYALYKPYF